MGRIMALDVGQKRVGIAVSDESQIIASPLTTVGVHQLLAFITEYLQHDRLDCLVIGEPKTLQGTNSDATRFIEPVVKQLKKAFPGLTIARYDERFTSAMALDALIAGGVPKMQRRDKTLADKISAAIILRDYMESEKRKQL
jgi:putative holliday junction resolvase